MQSLAVILLSGQNMAKNNHSKNIQHASWLIIFLYRSSRKSRYDEKIDIIIQPIEINVACSESVE
jgi:hypothetical protein